MSHVEASLNLRAFNALRRNPVRAVNWQRREATSVEDIGPADIEALLAAADDEDSEIDFDLGEPWDAQFDPTEDDPE